MIVTRKWSHGQTPDPLTRRFPMFGSHVTLAPEAPVPTPVTRVMPGTDVMVHGRWTSVLTSDAARGASWVTLELADGRVHMSDSTSVLFTRRAA